MAEVITSVGLDAHKVCDQGRRDPAGGEQAGGVAGREREGGGATDGQEAPAPRRQGRFASATRPAPAAMRCNAGSGSRARRVWWWLRSLIPRKPGDRIKTDRRDARKLAELFRAGLLTEVHPPSPEDEAVRDLCRAREDAHEDLVRCRHRLSKMLLRRGWTWHGSKKAWSQGHRLWLRSLRLSTRPTRSSSRTTCWRSTSRAAPALTRATCRAASQLPAYAEAVAALRCFRGIDTITAMSLVAELHDFLRFDSPRGLMAFLGLVPSEHSSGGKDRRGGDHQGRQRPRPPPAYRGVLALPPPPQHLSSLRKRRQGQPARSHRPRRQGHAPPLPALQPHDRERQAPTQGRRRHRPRARRLHLGRHA